MARTDVHDFEKFLDQNLGGMSRLAMLLTLDPHDAEDLVQQAALKLQQKWRLVRRADNPPAYARRLLVNEFLALKRAKRREARTHMGAAMATASEDVAAQVERRQIVTELLRTLPERQRAAIVLRYLEDRPDREIASILSCREATVRSLVKRGLDAMRRGASDSSRTEKERSRR